MRRGVAGPPTSVRNEAADRAIIGAMILLGAHSARRALATSPSSDLRTHAAVAGVALAASGAPRRRFGRKPGSAIGGLALAAGAVLVIVAIHWGSFG